MACEMDWETYFETSDSDSEFIGFTDIDVEKTVRLHNYKRDTDPDRPMALRVWEDRIHGTHDLLPRFTGLQPRGCANPLSDEAEEIDWFFQIFDEGLIANITEQTNNYADQRRRANRREARRKPGKAWRPITVREMKAFLGVIILFGLVRLPEISFYWKRDNIFGHSLVSRAFSRDRFELILRYLYYSNERYCKQGTGAYARQKEAEKVDKMLKVRPVIERVNRNSRFARNPKRELSIDEGVIPNRGRNGNVTYNPAKPHKYGMRVYTLSEPATGYVYNDEIHQGIQPGNRHPTEDRSVDNPTFFRGNKPGQVVNRLLRPYYGRGHHVVVDSYYTSAALFDHLYSLDTVATGTCKKLTPGIPPLIKEPERHEPMFVPPEYRGKRRPRNEWHRGSYSMLQDGVMTVCAWQDTKFVKLMSTAVNPNLTYNRPNNEVSRRSKNKTTGQYQKQQVPCPRVVIEYNKYFGGVDLTDQRLSYYPPGRTSIRWHRAVFYHEINKALVNAYLNWAERKEIQKSSRKGRAVNFRANVANQLIGNFTARRRTFRTLNIGRVNLQREAGRAHHILDRNPSGKPRTCVMCRQARRGRQTGNNTIRSPETRWWCKTCQVPVCRPTSREICWAEHNV